MIRLLLYPGLPYLFAASVLSVWAWLVRRREYGGPAWDGTARRREQVKALAGACERSSREHPAGQQGGRR